MEEKESTYICKTCYKCFDTDKKLKMHINIKHFIPDKFTCALCSEIFNSNNELLKHKIIHKAEDRNFLCMTCETAFSDHLEFLTHKTTHENILLYFCLECGKEYDKKKSYISHIKVDYDNMVKCDMCERDFRSNRIKDHVKESHSKHGKINCVECGVDMPKSKMDYHMTSHTGVKPFQCLYCGKGFSNRSQRNVHTRIHTEERPYECTMCHLKCRQSTDLNRHMETHTMKKSIECTVCGTKFTHKISLKYHMDIHNNTQKYPCKFCDKKLHTATSLKSHVERTHLMEKKFKCIPCGVGFKTKPDLYKHNKHKSHINNQFGYDRKLKENNEL